MMTMMTCVMTDEPGPSADCELIDCCGVEERASGGAPELPEHALRKHATSGTQKKARQCETVRMGEAY